MNNLTLKKNNGFTLLELVIVMTISGVLFVAASVVLSAGFRSYFSAKEYEAHHLSYEVAMNRMAREIRSANHWVALQQNNLQFYDNAGLLIHYYIQQNQLMRQQQNNPARPLLANVNSLLFNYYDAILQPTNHLTKTHYVRFTFEGIKENNTISYQSIVFARNAP